MAGVTDHPFRKVCREEGCELVFSEMISARGLLYMPWAKVKKLAHAVMADQPIAVQLLGREPDIMAGAAAMAEEVMAPRFIDINMGCPAKKVIKNREGAWLLREPLRAAAIMEAVVNNTSVPVTVKIRKGWDQKSIVAREMVKIAEETGISAVSIHGRTVEDGFSGRADWDIIRAIRRETSLPVIGSGDVFTPEGVKNMLNFSGCDGMMIARGAMGNPWIFSRTRALLEEGRILPEPEIRAVVQKVLHHLDLVIAEYDEKHGIKEMRKHAHWYMKGFPGAANLRKRINSVTSGSDFRAILTEVI